MANLTTKLALILFTSSFLFSCSDKENIERAVYIWKAKQSFEQHDAKFITSNKISKIYIRFFDTSTDGKGNSKPKSELKLKGETPTNVEIIPTIFIENNVFLQLKKKDLNKLPKQILSKIFYIFKQRFPKHKLQEIQFDCDWTLATRVNYFSFLKQFKQKNPEVEISATIRLHQIKYQQKTGVPPVDKGVLMYYNMGDIKEIDEPNSILNNEIGQLYISDKTRYPVELSLALPVYSWGIWFKNSKFKSLIYDINEQNIHELSFLTPIKNNNYQVNKDTVFAEKYLRNGDVLRVEIPKMKALEEAKKICKNLKSNKKPQIIIFSYDNKNSNYFSSEKLEKIYSNY